MNLEQLREYCLSFSHATEDVKWGNDLCFSVGGKMFCVAGIEPGRPLTFSFKCTPERFAELAELDGIIPAPYVARYHWVRFERPDALAERETRALIAESYRMVFDKLPAKVKKNLT